MSIDTKTVYLRNLDTGEVKKYDSLTEAAKTIGTEANVAFVYVDRYIYKKIWWMYHAGQSEYPPEKRRNSKEVEVWIKDISSGEVSMFPNITAACKHTKLKASTLRNYIFNKLSHNGLVFSSNGIFPDEIGSNIVTPSWLKKRDYIAEPCN